MNKSNLENNYVVKFRNKKIGTIKQYGEVKIIFLDKFYIWVDDLDKNLKHKFNKQFDVIEIYNFDFENDEKFENAKIIWKRKED